jgi:hypothetical protein
MYDFDTFNDCISKVPSNKVYNSGDWPSNIEILTMN